MLIRDLVDYANRSGAPVRLTATMQGHWAVEIRADGTFHAAFPIVDPVPAGKGKPKTSVMIERPISSRTSGVSPQLVNDTFTNLFTKDKYVGPSLELAAEWAAEYGGPLVALEVFFREHRHLAAAAILAQAGTKDPSAQWVEIRIATPAGYVPITSTPEWEAAWLKTVTQVRGIGLCPHCGRTDVELLRIMPGGIARIGGKSGLVAINDQVSGGWGEEKDGLKHTPVCVECGFKHLAALNHLTETDSTYLKVDGKGHTDLYIWWGGEVDFTDLFAASTTADPAIVRDIHRAVQGRNSVTPGSVQGSDSFSFLRLRNVQGRVAVMGYETGQPVLLARNLWNWLAAMQPDGVDLNTGEGHPTVWGLRQLAVSTVAHAAGVPRKGHPERALANVLPVLANAALTGQPLPSSLLSGLVRRLLTDGHFSDGGPLSDARCALLRLALRTHPERVNMPTDIAKLQAYGRLLANFDEIQRVAIGTHRTAVRGRLARLVSNPGRHYTQLRIEAEPWLTKLTTRNQTWAAKNISDISEHVGDELPDSLTPAEQAVVLLALDTQRFAFLRARNNTVTAINTTEQLAA